MPNLIPVPDCVWICKDCEKEIPDYSENHFQFGTPCPKCPDCGSPNMEFRFNKSITKNKEILS